MKQLLLVEDDQTLGITLQERLSKEGHAVDWAKTIRDAREFFEKKRYDLLVLDVGLPDGSGLDFARDVKLASNAAVIFLSAMSSAEYRLEGFELGAEDYIPKPFHLKELLLRISKILGAQPSAVLTAGVVTLDPASLAVVFSDGSREFLAKRDFQILRVLVERAPEALSREQILSAVTEEAEGQSGRTIDNAIMRLRQVLKKSEADPIRSVRGIGYQWVG